jgi:hypothetical protein
MQCYTFEGRGHIKHATGQLAKEQSLMWPRHERDSNSEPTNYEGKALPLKYRHQRADNLSIIIVLGVCTMHSRNENPSYGLQVNFF